MGCIGLDDYEDVNDYEDMIMNDYELYGWMIDGWNGYE